MKYKCPLIVVDDMSVARDFYENVLDQTVILDFGANIVFKGDFCLQTKETWLKFIDKDKEDIYEENNDFELYFDEVDFDGFVIRLTSYNITYLHGVKEYPWGQRVVRFYDPDKNIIEVGESMESVVRKFLREGLSLEEIAIRTQYPLEFIRNCRIR